MDDLDKLLLTSLQTALPVEPRPFDALAAQLGIEPEECLERVRRLVAEGLVRRIGPVFDSRRLGYVSTLVAARIPPDRLDDVAARITRLPGVTHNYERRHAYNLWFTLTALSAEALAAALGRLQRETGAEFHSLPALAVYKIRVQFDLTEEAEDALPSPLPSPAGGRGIDNAPSPQPSPTLGRGREDIPLPLAGEGGRRPGEGTPNAILTADQKALVRMIQDGLAVEREPFEAVARQLGWPVDRVVQELRQWTDSGIIRRFGAVVRHTELGFRANGMSVFRVPPAAVDDAGRRLAAHAKVSHCYRRPPLPDFPYNLFAMIHGRTEDEVRTAVDSMALEVPAEIHDVLFSVREFKKVSMRYFVE